MARCASQNYFLIWAGKTPKTGTPKVLGWPTGNNLVCGIIINQLYNQLIIIYLVKLVVVKSFDFHYSIIGFVKYPMMTGS